VVEIDREKRLSQPLPFLADRTVNGRLLLSRSFGAGSRTTATAVAPTGAAKASEARTADPTAEPRTAAASDAVHPGSKGPLSKPTTATEFWPPERVSMPRLRGVFP
jgi:hypothetical protein